MGTGYAQIAEADEQYSAIRFNAEGQVEKKVYCASGYTQYAVYMIDQSTSGCAAATPATVATATARAWVPQGATTSTAGWYWGVIEGQCEASVDGDSVDVAAGYFLKMGNGSTALVVDHATVATEKAVAIAIDANTGTAATKTIDLLGRFATI